MDAGGKPFSFDLYYKLLETMEASLDENDELSMPSMIGSPALIEKINELPPLTPEQQTKLDALMMRKREEALARRRRRRLS